MGEALLVVGRRAAVFRVESLGEAAARAEAPRARVVEIGVGEATARLEGVAGTLGDVVAMSVVYVSYPVVVGQ